MKICFTLCSNNYLAQAKVLGDSFLKYNPFYQFVIGLVDEFDPTVDYSFFKNFEIIRVASIDIDGVNLLIEKYNIIEFNTAVKPFFFQYLFKRDQPDHIIYLDPDIAVFSKFTEIEDRLAKFDFLLTPHLLTAKVNIEPEKETLVLNVGNYNLGFLALRNSKDAGIMLEWWKHRMLKYCYIDFCNGLFVDQIWANFIPCYFSNYHILRSYGYNVGYWNFDERQLSSKNGIYYVNEQDRLIFFHVSNYNPLQPEKLCKWLDYSFTERPDLQQLYLTYTKALLDSKFAKFSMLKPLLEFRPLPTKPSKQKRNFKQKVGNKIKYLTTKTIDKLFNLT